MLISQTSHLLCPLKQTLRTAQFAHPVLVYRKAQKGTYKSRKPLNSFSPSEGVNGEIKQDYRNILKARSSYESFKSFDAEGCFSLHFCLGTLIAAAFVLIYQDWIKQNIKELTLNFFPLAAELKGDSERKSNVRENNVAVEEKKKKKRKMGFREKRIIEYENRLRRYSTPEKIFRYFASFKVVNEGSSGRPFEIYMTPKDFVRSITPGIMQPRGVGLDQFRVYDPEKHGQLAEPGSVFQLLDDRGLISFGDYIFLITLLTTSPSDFKLAFNIFDVDGDGLLDEYEFGRMQELIMSQKSNRQRNRDNPTVGLYINKRANSALSKYFFGNDGTEKLSAEKFLIFQAHLHRDILRIEIARRDIEALPLGMISETSFADILLVYSGVSEAKRRKMLKRVKKKYKSSSEYEGITMEEVEAFFCLLYYIEEVDLALHFYNVAGASISGKILKEIAKKVVGREISDHVVDVVITLFDENMDGLLSRGEFVSVMKKRANCGLEKPRDTGLLQFLEAMRKCAITIIEDTLI